MNGNDGSQPHETPFDRFSKFARKLLAVPKKELDEQEAKYQRDRQKRRNLKGQKSS